MSVKYDKFTRRQFLVGLGGYGLILPFLPSLLSREARAQVMNGPRRMFMMTMGHNLMASQSINPALATQVVAPGIKQIAINGLASNALGTYMTHPTITSLKNSGLITIARGLDSMATPDAHGSTWLTGGVINSTSDSSGIMTPSMDTYLETSPTLYPTGQSFFRKILRCNGSISFKKVGSQVVQVTDAFGEDANNNWNGARNLYNQMVGLFGTGGGGNPPPPQGTQGSILNLVYESYTNVKNNRRISSDDRNVFENHMSLISELEATFGSSTPPTPLACTNPITDMSMVNNASLSYYDRALVYMKLISVALSCGMTKCVIFNAEGHGKYDIGPNQADFPVGDGIYFHNQVVHNEAGFTIPQQETQYTYWFKWHMDKLSDIILGPLSATQDPQNSNGKSILENMAAVVLTEAGVHANPGSHINLDYQPIIFGNMGGILSSNKFVVYDRGTTGRGFGPPANQLMITLLQAMGLPQSEYAGGSSNGQGFGIYPTSGGYYDRFRTQFYNPLAEIWHG